MAAEERATAHRDRLRPYVDPHLARRETGIKHPVHDFLFEYYRFRPAQLLRWTPGASHLPEEKRTLVSTLLRLLRATAGRAGNFGCFGLHEWAMVYRSDENRHPQPLRLGGPATDEVVESHRIACSHFDAYRFFTADARELNTLRPGSSDRAEFEQPACLHGGMDLYGKVATRLAGLIASDLVADAFELAWDIRILDMRAAPYDMTGVVMDPSGEEWTPIRIETAEGKQEYARQQRAFAERAAPIRERLIEECERLLASPAR